MDYNRIIKPHERKKKTTCAKKANSATQAIAKKERPKRPAISQTLIEIPPGEDQTSFDRHNRLLEIEFTRARRNESTVKELMKFSYAMRRNDILENGHTINVLEKYPFLQTLEHVSNELKLKLLLVCG